MITLKLDGGYTLAVERDGKRARLVVYKNGVENVCRKDTVSNLERFIRSDMTQTFKGRLQLHKAENGIDVKVKGQVAGTVKAADFLDLIKDKLINQN